MPEERCLRCSRRVPWVTFWGNVGLTVYKGLIGWVGNSNALIADAFHSFTDIIGTAVVLLSCRIAGRPPDESHPYGHGKAEFLSAAFIYLVLSVLAVLLFAGGLLVILRWELHPPSVITLLGAFISIMTSLLMSGLGICAGRRTNSPALLANAFENRADALASTAVVVGIGLGILVHPVCDSLAAMAVGVIIFVNCLGELGKALSGLMDRSLPPEMVQHIREVVLADAEVRSVRFIKSRPTGSQYWVDVGVTLRGGMQVSRAEEIAARVSRAVMTRGQHFQYVEVFVMPEGGRE